MSYLIVSHLMKWGGMVPAWKQMDTTNKCLQLVIFGQCAVLDYIIYM